MPIIIPATVLWLVFTVTLSSSICRGLALLFPTLRDVCFMFKK